MTKEKVESLPELLSIMEFSGLLGISTMTLRRWDTNGILKFFRPTPSSQRRYKKTVVEKFLKSK